MVELSPGDVETLRRLERILTPARHHPRASKAALVRVALPTAAVAAALAVGLIMWPAPDAPQNNPVSGPEATTISQRAVYDFDQTHEDALQADRALRAEFAKAASKHEVRPRWFENEQLLTYQNPWRPK